MDAVYLRGRSERGAACAALLPWLTTMQDPRRLQLLLQLLRPPCLPHRPSPTAVRVPRDQELLCCTDGASSWIPGAWDLVLQQLSLRNCTRVRRRAVCGGGGSSAGGCAGGARAEGSRRGARCSSGACVCAAQQDSPGDAAAPAAAPPRTTACNDGTQPPRRRSPSPHRLGAAAEQGTPGHRPARRTTRQSGAARPRGEQLLHAPRRRTRARPSLRRSALLPPALHSTFRAPLLRIARSRRSPARRWTCGGRSAGRGRAASTPPAHTDSVSHPTCTLGHAGCPSPSRSSRTAPSWRRGPSTRRPTTRLAACRAATLCWSTPAPRASTRCAPGVPCGAAAAAARARRVALSASGPPPSRLRRAPARRAASAARDAARRGGRVALGPAAQLTRAAPC